VAFWLCLYRPYNNGDMYEFEGKLSSKIGFHGFLPSHEKTRRRFPPPP
jgi:hypothetical protein